jgi:hypothetical protein
MNSLRAIEEAIDILNIQHQLGVQLLEITSTMQGALKARDREGFSRRLDQRQNLFTRLHDLQAKVHQVFGYWHNKDEMPMELTELIARNKNLLDTILELDKECYKVGEEFKSEVGVSLGRSRTRRKIHQGYGLPSLRKQAGFIDGKA